MSTESIHLDARLYAYYHKFSLREPQVLKDLRQATHKLSQFRMQISPEQGQFMALLVALLSAKKTLDIGTFTGYSALVVALALPEQGQVIACDTSLEWTTLAQRFWEQAGVAHKIHLKLAPAKDTLSQLIRAGEEASFDFAFIDADKANYSNYYELCLQLLRPGGLIAVDNVLWGGKVADPAVQDAETGAIRALNEHILKDERVTMSMLPIGDGLTLVRKNL